eukprot:PhF_6_TR6920/c0_g1_i5/m.10093
MTKLPASMKYFYFRHNQLSGVLDLSMLPLKLLELDLSQNKFEGSVVLDFLPPELMSLNLSHNLLCGEPKLPDMENVTFDVSPAFIDCNKTLSIKPSNTTKPSTNISTNITTPLNSHLRRAKVSAETEELYTSVSVLLVSNANAVSTGGSLLVIPPDVVFSSQLMYLSHQCQNPMLGSAETTHHTADVSFRRPSLSLGRLFTMPSVLNNVLDERGDLWEVSMIVMSTGFVYGMHLVIMCLLMVFKRRSEQQQCSPQQLWCWTLYWSRFPGYSIQYHLSLLVPFVSSCTAGVLSASFLKPVVTSLTGLYILVLITFHTLTSGAYFKLQFVGSGYTTNRKTLSYWFLPTGNWNPKTALSMGGPFFASYTD